MKTNLPVGIGTIDQAKAFLTELYRNGESFHPEDDAREIIWTCDEPTLAEQESLNALMLDIYSLPGNDGSHVNMVFDPCEFLLKLDPEYTEDDDLAEDQHDARNLDKY